MRIDERLETKSKMYFIIEHYQNQLEELANEKIDIKYKNMLSTILYFYDDIKRKLDDDEIISDN